MSDNSVKKLTDEYIKIKKRIFELLAFPKNEKATDYAKKLTNEANKNIDEIIKKINKWARDDLRAEVDKAEKKAENALKDEPKKLTLKETDVLLKKLSGQSGRQAITLGAVAEMSAAARQAGREFQRTLKTAINRLEKEGKTSVWDISQELKKHFTEENILAVKYANGARVPLDKYTAMLARTALVEVQNYATIRATIRHGHDLVYWHSVDNPCRICALYRNKVYSISGQDKRFPYLFDTALHPGYWTVHPNNAALLRRG